jgi:hypothetical protein
MACIGFRATAAGMGGGSFIFQPAIRPLFFPANTAYDSSGVDTLAFKVKQCILKPFFGSATPGSEIHA